MSAPPPHPESFLEGLKRRKVLRAATIYVAIAYAAIEGTDILTPQLGLPDWLLTAVLVGAAIGLPFVLLVSWHYDVTATGFERTGATPEVEAEPATRVAERSVAVLPFSNLSDEAENEYFSDGVTEEIINALAQLPGLHVAARTSSFSFKGKPEDVTVIGERLSVANVLEGSVRRAGSRIRITAQLVSCRDGYHLWSEVYDREIEDVFAIQDDIARSIAERMKVQLLGDVDGSLVRYHTEDLESYNLYLKGRYVWNQRTSTGLRRSIDFFEQATREDSGYALAYAGLADAYSILGWYRHMEPRQAFEKTKVAAGAALDLDDSLAEAHTSLAYARFLYDWDQEGAEAEFRRAIELNPLYTTALHWYAEFLMAMGRLDEAQGYVDRAHELDPLSLSVATGEGWVRYFRGDFEGAIDQYLSVLAVDPNYVIIPWFLGPAFVQAGQIDRAIALYESWIPKIDNPAGLKALLGHALAREGRRDDAVRLLRVLEDPATDPHAQPDGLALVHLGLGDRERALDQLEAACEQRCWPLVFLRVDPVYEPLRDEPRYAALLEKTGLVA